MPILQDSSLSSTLLTLIHISFAPQYSGLVNDKAVGIEPAANGRGIVVSTKKTKAPRNKIAGTRNVQTISSGGSRRAAGAVANIVGKRGYRSDLLKVSKRSGDDGGATGRPKEGQQEHNPRKNGHQRRNCTALEPPGRSGCSAILDDGSGVKAVLD